MCHVCRFDHAPEDSCQDRDVPPCEPITEALVVASTERGRLIRAMQRRVADASRLWLSLSWPGSDPRVYAFTVQCMDGSETAGWTQSRAVIAPRLSLPEAMAITQLPTDTLVGLAIGAVEELRKSVA